MSIEKNALVLLCAGHFPGRPIVPGSHLVGLMVDVAGLIASGVGVELRRAVFRAPVGPEAPLWIRACLGRSPGRIDAEVLRQRHVASGDGPGERTVVASARIEVVT